VVEALRRIARDHCSTFTGTGGWSCRKPGSGRSIDAYFTAERWCDQCIALDALERLPVDNFPPDDDSLHDATSNNPVDNSDDPFTKMDIPEAELPFIQVDNSYGVFIQIIDPDLVVMVRRKEQS